MAIYKVKYGQSIYDIATQIYGSVLGVAYLLRDNKSIDLTTHLKQGFDLIVNATSDTIIDQNIVSFFKNKTITNTETLKGVENLLTEIAYGTIVTSSPEGDYVNGVMRATPNQLNMINVESTLLNYDRVKFNKVSTLNEDADEIEFIISYEPLSSPNFWIVLAGSDTVEGSHIRIDSSNKLSLYSSSDQLLITSSNTVSPNVDISVKIRCEVIVTNVVVKNYYLEVNGVEDSTLDVSDINISFDTLGGFEKDDVWVSDRLNSGSFNGLSTDSFNGLNGSFKYLRYNDSEYRFDEGGGIYIFKTNK
tara:strand:- start:178 stop:1092 length:915 start_codon:yes stop_codon:yes gene_type:complete